MSVSNEHSQAEHTVVQFKPYRRVWFKSAWGGQAQPVSGRHLTPTANNCDECWGPLRQGCFETYCGVCGLVHQRQVYWEKSLEIEAGRRQFDHDSEEGSGTLQNRHVTVVEDSAGETTFDGSELSFNVYPLDQYNDGRDGHRGRQDDFQKLDRERRFLEQRAEACATAAGLTGENIREVTRVVTSINSGAFTSYAPEREGGGQDAHIVAAIVVVGNDNLPDNPDRVEFSDRMQYRDAVQTLAEGLEMNCHDIHGAASQLREQLRKERE